METGWEAPHFRNDKTAYIIGLFGAGRWYINELVLQNLGERSRYFRDEIRFHPGPTSMIYSGHATMKHVSRFQALPAVTALILQAVREGFADLIFVYRHPFDSLLTNWIWWRTYLRDNNMVSGVSQVYKNTDSLCTDLERNFAEFKAFAEGDPDFFAAPNVPPGPRFLSFAEFVEETELYVRAATLALRLEGFMSDPLKEFRRILEIMPADLDLSRLSAAPPRTQPYRYLTVREKVPQFSAFIDGLDAETKRRIETIGYPGSFPTAAWSSANDGVGKETGEYGLSPSIKAPELTNGQPPDKDRLLAEVQAESENRQISLWHSSKALAWRASQLVQRDATIQEMEKALDWRASQIIQRDATIQGLEKTVVWLQQTTGDHKRALAIRTRQIEELEHELERTLKRFGTVIWKLEEIQQSSGWKFILWIRKSRDRLLPDGSLRRRFFHSILRLVTAR